MKLTEAQARNLGDLKWELEKLSKLQDAIFKEACEYLNIDEDSQKGTWLFDYLFNDLNVESLEANL